MKKLILLLNFIFCVLTFSFAQTVAPGIAWQNTIGGNNRDELHSISQTSDGGYICGGMSSSNISGDKTENRIGGLDYWILKLDSIGNIQWQNTIGGNLVDDLISISQTVDGGYICGGRSTSDSAGDKAELCLGNYDYWILKLDSIGNIVWQNTIGGNENDDLTSISQTHDGGYIVGGFSISDSSGDKTEASLSEDYWIIKLDGAGNIQWQKTIGGSLSDELYSIIQLSNGGYICGGYSNSSISGDKTENNFDTSGNTFDYWIIQLDSVGNIKWQNTIGGNDYDWFQSMAITADGGYACGGVSSSSISGDKTENSLGYNDYWIVKLDSLGNIQWENTICADSSEFLYSIIATSDNGILCAGSSQSTIACDKIENNVDTILYRTDFWVVKLDPSGNVVWQNDIGGNSVDILASAVQTYDGGFILGGFSDSNSSGDKTEDCNGQFDYWIVKLNPDTTTGIKPIPSSTFNIQTTPNPFTNELTVSIPQLSTEAQLILLDVYGKQVLTQTTPAKTLNIKLQTLNLAKGVYFLHLQNGKQIVTRKVVKM